VPEIVPVDVPPVREKTTVDPPVVIKFPAASRAVKVRVISEPEITVGLETATVEVAIEIAPGLTVIVGRAVVIVEPLMVAFIVVADPESTPVNKEV
jgi:hypothetical protein